MERWESRQSNLIERQTSNPLACALQFFIAPVFEPKEESKETNSAGYYNLIVQFFEPSHFVCANLSAYQQNPAEAPPVLSFSVFDDYIESLNITLVRADVVVDSFQDDSVFKVIGGVLKRYDGRDYDKDYVHQFNNAPGDFNFDDFIESSRQIWFGKEGNAGGKTSE